MTSLTDVYRRRVGAVASRRRVFVGAALFALGAGLTAAGVVLATTHVGSRLGLGTYGAREWAGVLAGLGLPAVFVGVFAVLPTSRVTRAAAAIGASLCVFAVALFTHAYPTQWPGAPAADPLVALLTLGAYFAGAVTTGWCLFVAVATFKTRKSPGGTAEMRITEEGRIKLVRDAGGLGGTGSFGGVGGVGLFGTDPDGEVPTQTGNTETNGDDSSTTRTVSDGGSAAVDAADDGAEVLEAARKRATPDRYCGNCEHFHYVRVDEDAIEPYCDFHGRYMDDMDACSDWSATGDDRTQ
ncbi:DUF7139 domain-containing protein [Halorhabdus amylolytica]|uniref:DUF7139 domain-containing protein n=1 Tax=Halorhabdus amylolytica TaxID=2559573 RepID=UPI0010AA969D|nr:DUF418 domain-containing protein [Halorhabdus amylolytica]